MWKDRPEFDDPEAYVRGLRQAAVFSASKANDGPDE